jgi:hypothetical protein
VVSEVCKVPCRGTHITLGVPWGRVYMGLYLGASHGLAPETRPLLGGGPQGGSGMAKGVPWGMHGCAMDARWRDMLDG